MPNITLDDVAIGLKQYAVSHSQDIKTTINQGLDWEDASRYRPANYSWVEQNATVGDVLQTYQPNVSTAKSDFTLSGEETKLEDGMVFTTFDQAQLQQFVTTQVFNYRELGNPVEQQPLWKILIDQLILPKFRENLNTVSFKGKRREPNTTTPLPSGEYAPGTPSAVLDTFTGFNERIKAIITAGRVTPAATGAITSTNVLTSVNTVCASIPEFLRFLPGKVYMSQQNRVNFINNLIAAGQYTYVPGLTNDQYAIVPTYNKQVVGVNSMTGSNRIIVELDTRPAFLIAVDAVVGSFPALQVVKNSMFTLQVGMQLRRGFGLTYAQNLFVNDQV